MKITIINSKGHWVNGWVMNPEKQRIITDILQRAGLKVQVIEVASLGELQQALDKASADTLIWPNAYLLHGEAQQAETLVDRIEKYQLPLVGSGHETLMRLLQKDTCQRELKRAGIPVSPHVVIEKDEISALEGLILSGGLEFPVVLKPTKESRSNGVVMAANMGIAIEKAKDIAEKYPDSKIIIEEFLPGDDVTCGYFQMGDDILLLPSYCAIEGLDCKTGIYSEYHYRQPHTIESHPNVEDESIIAQFQQFVPAIADLFDIRSHTRVDARLDKKGTLRFFDINGMPGLNFPMSAVIKQAVTHFPSYSREFLFQCLIHTVVGEALLRYDLPIPTVMERDNLFNLESRTVWKGRNQSVRPTMR